VDDPVAIELNAPAKPAIGILEVARRAGRFREHVETVKSQLGPIAFSWYPNDSLASFETFDTILSGKFRGLLDNPGERCVLDIGPADGHVAFFLESLGFRVKAIDHPETSYNRMCGIRQLKEALHSRIEIISEDIDSQFKLPEGEFDLVFFLDVLYHLKNPYYALELLSRHARFCFLSTRVARVTPEMRNTPLAYLVDADELNRDATNFWTFSEAVLKRLLRRTGWEICNYGTTGDTLKSNSFAAEDDERVFCLLRSRHLTDTGLTARLLKGWHVLEQGKWRWTERRFSVELAVPDLASGAALLELRFVYPECVKPREGPLRLLTSLDGLSLDEAQYSTSGEHLYRASVPSDRLQARTAIVEFELNHALPPDATDLRERGIIVTNIGLYGST
jgi:2-polyprenyl-3-methyl-5-hydroxy-6-metoxy-1,4-benzoquinol methylase